MVAIAAMIAIAAIVQVVFGVSGGSALYFYAGVTAARLADERLAIGAIAAAGIAATLATGVGSSDWSDGLVVGVTVATISLTLFALARLGRANRELQAARRELADLAVAEERTRIARDLHDTLGHSLSVIALKSELARRVLPDDPERAAAEIGDVERVAREALASVRDTVSGYRQPTLAMELAGAREALTAAGIDGDVEPAPEGLPREVDAVLGWAVREGVTNVLRHSDAARARVRVIVDDRVRAVEVEDDGQGVAGAPLGAAPNGARSGTGLDGLRERAATVGGSLEAGPRADGGFRLRVAVPGRARRGTRRVTRVLLAEDQAMVRGALAALLALEPDLEVVAEVGRGDEVVPRALDTRPDVALLDIEMPGLDGLAAAAQLRTAVPACRVVILTTFGRPGYLRRAMEAGATGFLLKDAPATELADAIRRVARGQRVVDPALAVAALSEGANPLSEREREALALAATSGTVADIATSLGLSEGTVRNHLSAAIQKMGARNRAEAARIAADKGWLAPETDA